MKAIRGRMRVGVGGPGHDASQCKLCFFLGLQSKKIGKPLSLKHKRCTVEAWAEG